MHSAAYREYPPGPALRPYVACYWTLRGTAASAHRVLPDGCLDLLFDLAAPGGPRAALIGAMTTALLVDGGLTDLLGVRLRPGEALAVVGCPAAEATDRSFGLSELWGREAADLAAAVAALPSTSARLALLERRLLARRRRPDDARARYAVAALTTRPAATRVGALAGELGLSPRHLERMFHDRVGLSPKVYAGVARLQALLPYLGAPPAWRRTWSELAQILGYADQAHLSREVKRLSGVTPTALAMSGSFNPPTRPLATSGA